MKTAHLSKVNILHQHYEREAASPAEEKPAAGQELLSQLQAQRLIGSTTWADDGNVQGLHEVTRKMVAKIFRPVTDRCIKHTQPTKYNDWWDKTCAPPHLVSWAELVNGKDLSWVKSFTEYVYSSQLTTKHPVSVRCLWGTQETLIIALQNKREKYIK